MPSHCQWDMAILLCMLARWCLYAGILLLCFQEAKQLDVEAASISYGFQHPQEGFLLLGNPLSQTGNQDG